MALADGGSGARGPHAAALPALGYLYQIRYALLLSVERLRNAQGFTVSIETLDDVVFEERGRPLELLQTKHHVRKNAGLADGSADLWGSLRVWCEGLAAGQIPEDAIFFLVTTSRAAEGSAAHYLRPGVSRDVGIAMQRLNSTAQTSVSHANSAAYATYRSLDPNQRDRMLNAMYLVDASPGIQDLETELMTALRFAVHRGFLGSFLQRLEGWWYQRAIRHLRASHPDRILSQELEGEMELLREQFKQDSLPVDDDIMSASVEASGYEDRPFVHQLRLIEVGNPRILYAIKNYFRAFEQRSRWIREDLLVVGELERYETLLVEEWDVRFQQMRDQLGEAASEEAKKREAQALYKWVESESQFQIRPGVTHPAISRGTYQILSDAQRVGWHMEFRERLRRLLEPGQVRL